MIFYNTFVTPNRCVNPPLLRHSMSALVACKYPLAFNFLFIYMKLEKKILEKSKPITFKLHTTKNKNKKKTRDTQENIYHSFIK